MNEGKEALANWVYEGVWGVLARLFRVPRVPPTLPKRGNERIMAFHPAPGYLLYLKFMFWLGLMIIDGAITIGWLVLFIAAPVIGLILAPVAFVLAVLPDIIAYVALHLRYDTTWYVMSERSLRIRHGIWNIREMTFTFENVQNVSVTQGPLQRYFGIADVVVDTAGGGGPMQGQKGANMQSLHTGKLEGVENAAELRDLILSRLKQSKTTGLGDEHEVKAVRPAAGPWQPEHVAVLREIRDALRSLP